MTHTIKPQTQLCDLIRQLLPPNVPLNQETSPASVGWLIVPRVGWHYSWQLQWSTVDVTGELDPVAPSIINPVSHICWVFLSQQRLVCVCMHLHQNFVTKQLWPEVVHEIRIQSRSYIKQLTRWREPGCIEIQLVWYNNKDNQILNRPEVTVFLISFFATLDGMNSDSKPNGRLQHSSWF